MTHSRAFLSAPREFRNAPGRGARCSRTPRSSTTSSGTATARRSRVLLALSQARPSTGGVFKLSLAKDPIICSCEYRGATKRVKSAPKWGGAAMGCVAGA
eukprot:7820428-Pyramimonas_sp.AAC.1